MATENATDAARRLTDLVERTPVEIDTALAALYAEGRRLSGRVRVLLDDIHGAVNDRKRMRGASNVKTFGMTDADAVSTLTTQVDAGTVDLSHRHYAAQALENYHATTRALTDNRSEYERLSAEYERRGWSRFIIVQHVHSGYWCVGGTVRRTSERHWLPEYSGRNEAEAIAELAEAAHILCTHCFPNAPVVKPMEDPTMCGCKVYDTDKPKRSGYAYNNWATCKECGARASLTRTGNLRKHKRPSSEPGR